MSLWGLYDEEREVARGMYNREAERELSAGNTK